MLPHYALAEAKVQVDLEVQRFIGNVSTLDRSKFFNIHMVATENQVTQQELQYLVNDLKVGFGRQFWSPFSVSKAGSAYPNTAQAKANGANALAATLKHPNFNFYSTRNVVTEHPKAIYRPGDNRTEAARWAADYFKYYYNELTRPQFYEPMNEPFVHAGEFGLPAEQVRKEMTWLIRDIGKQFKNSGLNTKIIGYGSAWPSMELWDFRHFNERMKFFMDTAGADIDALSVHLYDGVNVTGSSNERSGSNVDAILDLIETYGYAKWQKVKPHAITEYGGIEQGYGDKYSDLKSVQSIRSINKMLFQLLDREDRMMTSVPFITGKAAWHYNAGNNWEPYGAVIIRPDKSSIQNGKPTRFIWTPRVHFYQLWSDVKGKRVEVLSDNPDVQVQAFVNGNTAYLALNSLSTMNESVSLDFAQDMRSAVSVHEKRLVVYPDRNHLYQDRLVPLATTVELEPGETRVLAIEFPSALAVKATHKEMDYYSPNYLQPIVSNKTLSFSIPGVEVGEGQSILRVGFARAHALSKRPTIRVNGQAVAVPTNWAGGAQSSRDEFFGALAVPVANSLLKRDNQIDITFAETGGRVSSVVLEAHSYKPRTTPDDTVSDSVTLPLVLDALPSAQVLNFAVDYVASASRDVVVELWKGNQYVTSSKTTVSKGSGRALVQLSPPSALVNGEQGYVVKYNIRPVGGDWRTALDAHSQAGIAVRTDAIIPGSQIASLTQIASLPASGTVNFSFNYLATQDADLVVEIWNQGQWQANGVTQVAAGADVAPVAVSLNKVLTKGNGGAVKFSIRPRGGNWQSTLDGDVVSGILVN
ncbi:hypothetical protein R50072_03130 [Simiduia litorea]